MKMSKSEVKGEILSFLEGTGGEWDWDDFISIPLDDPALDQIRKEAAGLPDRFPPTQPGYYASEEGLLELRKLADRLGDRP